jgi:hypothetical protein
MQAAGAPTSRSDKPGEFMSLWNGTAEPWTDAQRLRTILTRAVATCMLATADPPALVTAYFDAT